jgi:hypothetical protein
MVGVVRGVFGEVFISPLLRSNIRYIRAQGWMKLIGLSKINAPLKVQIFTSWLCGDIISTMTLLRAQGVSCSLNCPWSVHNETCYHVLFLCSVKCRYKVHHFIGTWLKNNYMQTPFARCSFARCYSILLAPVIG